eukprot:TRINITY_DN39851_c0_g1_i1.p1 TRINITY_DN39851_c0_g1~~TRINITY_DN39851_c0_g1_i1.p1  ORF type:complete len:253 (+),score=55.64 TRINITY_DN39851_c0_g1_i1:137-895(+)
MCIRDRPLPPPSPDAVAEDAEIEYAVSCAAMDVAQIEEVHKQATRQVARLQRVFNLIPLARQEKRSVLAPIIKHRRCEAGGWGQILTAMNASSTEKVKEFLQLKQESVLWSGNVAWLGGLLSKKFHNNMSSPPASPGHSSSPTRPWNSGYTNDHQRRYDKRLSILEDKRSQEMMAERGASSPGMSGLGLTNAPPSPELSRSMAQMLQQHQPTSVTRKSPVRTPTPALSPHDIERSHLHTTYYDTDASIFRDM